MVGAAYASLISILLYNIIKFIFIKVKMKISPFSINSIKIIIVGLIVLITTNYFIPSISDPLLDILIKSLAITSIYLGVLYKLNVSKKFNDILNQYIKIR
jgi:hypothetical protein